MTSAALVVVDHDTTTEDELRKRYGADYQVVAYRSAEEALRALPRLRAPVAVILAQLWLPAIKGVDLLGRVRDLLPTAKRALLASWSDEQGRERILEAIALGQIDCHLPGPGPAPDEGFHQVVGELLAEWARANAARPALVRVVGDRSAPRCAEIRDLLERYSIPFSFLGAESAEGRQVLAEVGADKPACPVMVLRDGRVLTDPTNLEAADAIGGSHHLADEPYDVVIVGAGPAGLAAAVYGASEGLRTLSSNGRRSADRRVPPPESATTSAFLGASVAATWPTEPSSRRCTSAPSSMSCVSPSSSTPATRTTGSPFRTGTK